MPKMQRAAKKTRTEQLAGGLLEAAEHLRCHHNPPLPPLLAPGEQVGVVSFHGQPTLDESVYKNGKFTDLAYFSNTLQHRVFSTHGFPRLPENSHSPHTKGQKRHPAPSMKCE